jgi:hypothetical protein
VEEHDYTSHCVQIHQVLALSAHLLRTLRIGPTGRKRATTTGDVKPIVPRDLELACEEGVCRLL